MIDSRNSWLSYAKSCVCSWHSTSQPLPPTEAWSVIFPTPSLTSTLKLCFVVVQPAGVSTAMSNSFGVVFSFVGSSGKLLEVLDLPYEGLVVFCEVLILALKTNNAINTTIPNANTMKKSSTTVKPSWFLLIK
jgi:hypothetical protein